jgi:hypothetical protein
MTSTMTSTVEEMRGALRCGAIPSLVGMKHRPVSRHMVLLDYQAMLCFEVMVPYSGRRKHEQKFQERYHKEVGVT